MTPRDYDPSPGLEKIKARVLAINAADDERYPIELGILERDIKRISNACYYQIPASAETRGHGTSGEARWWKQLLPDLLNEASTPAR
jgi:homoserine O-acetyltransferase